MILQKVSKPKKKAKKDDDDDGPKFGHPTVQKRKTLLKLATCSDWLSPQSCPFLPTLPRLSFAQDYHNLLNIILQGDFFHWYPPLEVKVCKT